MEINLETDEILKVVIDGTCEFEVWGERNEEGTMIIKNSGDHQMIKVEIFESEKGWGQHLLDTKKFKTKKEAEEFVAEHNSKNNKLMTPDIYTYAEVLEEKENEM